MIPFGEPPEVTVAKAELVATDLTAIRFIEDIFEKLKDQGLFNDSDFDEKAVANISRRKALREIIAQNK